MVTTTACLRPEAGNIGEPQRHIDVPEPQIEPAEEPATPEPATIPEPARQ